MSNWTQPVCNDCWDAEHPDRPSPRLDQGDTEVCCRCGCVSESGIYIRVDPKTVAYPRGVA